MEEMSCLELKRMVAIWVGVMPILINNANQELKIASDSCFKSL